MYKVESTWFVLFVSIGFFGLIALSLALVNDTRMDDGVVHFTEMHWWENLLALYSVVAIFSNIFASASHAYGNNIKWVWVNVVFWPASFYYTWKVFLKVKQHDKLHT